MTSQSLSCDSDPAHRPTVARLTGVKRRVRTIDRWQLVFFQMDLRADWCSTCPVPNPHQRRNFHPTANTHLRALLAGVLARLVAANAVNTVSALALAIVGASSSEHPHRSTSVQAIFLDAHESGHTIFRRSTRGLARCGVVKLLERHAGFTAHVWTTECWITEFTAQSSGRR